MADFAAEANAFLAAVVDGLRECFLDGLEMLELLADFVEPLASKCDDFFARPIGSMRGGKHLLDVVEAQTDGLCRTDELQTFKRLLRIDAVVRAGSRIRLEEAGAFVIANRRDGHADGSSELADRVGLHVIILTQPACCGELPLFALNPGFSYILRPGIPRLD
jgi:hypothetical protein